MCGTQSDIYGQMLFSINVNKKKWMARTMDFMTILQPAILERVVLEKVVLERFVLG